MASQPTPARVRRPRVSRHAPYLPHKPTESKAAFYNGAEYACNRPAMLPSLKRDVFRVTSEKPAPPVLTPSTGLTPRHALVFTDLNVDPGGSPPSDWERPRTEYKVDARVAKVSIYNCHNSNISVVPTVISGQLDLHASSRLDLHLCASPSPAGDLHKLETLQLDPQLHNVEVHFDSAAMVGDVILSPGKDLSDLRDLALSVPLHPSASSQTSSAGDRTKIAFRIADAEGNLHNAFARALVAAGVDLSAGPAACPGQYYITFDSRIQGADQPGGRLEERGEWRVAAAVRGEKDYPRPAEASVGVPIVLSGSKPLPLSRPAQ